MNPSVIYLETGSTDPYYNLAFEEYILCRRQQGDYLLLWQNDNTVVVGQNQNTEAEIDRAFVEAHRIRVVRRATGGGAVYHDLGNLNYSFITDSGGAEQAAKERFTRPIVEALQALGLRAEASGRNDILVEGRKVSGTAQRLMGDRILHHGTLLFDTDPAMAAGALRVDPAKFRSKSVQSVRGRIGNIRELLPKDMDLPAFWAHLKRSLAGGGAETGTVMPEERQAIEELRRTKYDTWAWNYGRSPRYEMENRRRWDGGTLEVHVSVEDGHLTGAAFLGDFLSRCPMEDLTEALRGCAFQREAVLAVLARYPLPDYFGTITGEEVLDTLFHVSPTETCQE